MSQSNNSSIISQPQTSEFQDCTPCRIMGGVTFMGLGAYLYMNSPPKTTLQGLALQSRARIFVPRGIAAGLVAVGVYRLLEREPRAGEG